MDQAVEISLSKRKLVISFLGCLVFVVAGAFFIYTPETFARKTAFRTETMIIIVGILSILFFGMCGYFIAKKLFSKVPGLTVSNRGITDHSSAVGGRFVPWSDVSEVGKVRVFRQSFVTIS